MMRMPYALLESAPCLVFVSFFLCFLWQHSVSQPLVSEPLLFSSPVRHFLFGDHLTTGRHPDLNSGQRITRREVQHLKRLPAS